MSSLAPSPPIRAGQAGFWGEARILGGCATSRDLTYRSRVAQEAVDRRLSEEEDKTQDMLVIRSTSPSIVRHLPRQIGLFSPTWSFARPSSLRAYHPDHGRVRHYEQRSPFDISLHCHYSKSLCQTPTRNRRRCCNWPHLVTSHARRGEEPSLSSSISLKPV